jgi:hypothetical protein
LELLKQQILETQVHIKEQAYGPLKLILLEFQSQQVLLSFHSQQQLQAVSLNIILAAE